MLRLAAALALGLSVSVAHADLLDRRDGLVYDTVTDLTWDLTFDVASRQYDPNKAYDRRFSMDVLYLFLRLDDYKGITTWTAPRGWSDYESLVAQATPAQLAGIRTDYPYWTRGGIDLSSFPPFGYYLWYDFATNSEVTKLVVDRQETAWVLPVVVGDIAAPVPEVTTYTMMLAGLGAIGFLSRRRALSLAL